MTLTPDRLFATLNATWPAAEVIDDGPFSLRRGSGGGKRVSAATLADGAAFDMDALIHAETRMGDWGQTPLFMIRDLGDPLDETLSARAYDVVDPSVFCVAPLETLLEIDCPRLSAFEIWPPLHIMRDIWSEGGIGSDRVEVMARVSAPRTALLGRTKDKAAGAAFVAAHDGIAMVHALEIRPELRRFGLASRMMGKAAEWAKAHGCSHMALAVTRANYSARNFYARLGMVESIGYHYRMKNGARSNIALDA